MDVERLQTSAKQKINATKASLTKWKLVWFVVTVLVLPVVDLLLDLFNLLRFKDTASPSCAFKLIRVSATRGLVFALISVGVGGFAIIWRILLLVHYRRKIVRRAAKGGGGDGEGDDGDDDDDDFIPNNPQNYSPFYMAIAMYGEKEGALLSIRRTCCGCTSPPRVIGFLEVVEDGVALLAVSFGQSYSLLSTVIAFKSIILIAKYFGRTTAELMTACCAQGEDVSRARTMCAGFARRALALTCWIVQALALCLLFYVLFLIDNSLYGEPPEVVGPWSLRAVDGANVSWSPSRMSLVPADPVPAGCHMSTALWDENVTVDSVRLEAGSVIRLGELMAVVPGGRDDRHRLIQPGSRISSILEGPACKYDNRTLLAGIVEADDPTFASGACPTDDDVCMPNVLAGIEISSRAPFPEHLRSEERCVPTDNAEVPHLLTFTIDTGDHVRYPVDDEALRPADTVAIIYSCECNIICTAVDGISAGGLRKGGDSTFDRVLRFECTPEMAEVEGYADASCRLGETLSWALDMGDDMETNVGC
jgi:hypothetical protein